jgi:hypothetical protein
MDGCNLPAGAVLSILLTPTGTALDGSRGLGNRRSFPHRVDRAGEYTTGETRLSRTKRGVAEQIFAA